MGLVNLYEFLQDHRRVDPPGWLAEEMREGDSAAAISIAAQSGRCPLCSEALDLFVHL
jgi:glucokinase